VGYLDVVERRRTRPAITKAVAVAEMPPTPTMHREEIVDCRATSAVVSDLSRDEREYFEERAAIREFDGGYPRSEAERLALDGILKRRNGGAS